MSPCLTSNNALSAALENERATKLPLLWGPHNTLLERDDNEKINNRYIKHGTKTRFLNTLGTVSLRIKTGIKRGVKTPPVLVFFHQWADDGAVNGTQAFQDKRLHSPVSRWISKNARSRKTNNNHGGSKKKRKTEKISLFLPHTHRHFLPLIFFSFFFVCVYVCLCI